MSDTNTTQKVKSSNLQSAKTIVVSSLKKETQATSGSGAQEHKNKTASFLFSTFANREELFKSDKDSDIDFLVNTKLSKFTDIPIDSHADPDVFNNKKRYETIEVFNEGGQGIISAAKEGTLGRIVALKTLRPEQSEGETLNSFISEAKVTAQLDHPSIIPIYSLEKDDEERISLAMKLVNGKSLRDYLKNVILQHRVRRKKKINEYAALGRRLEIFLSVCDAIAYAHHKGIMHCDLKPENIMIGEFMEVYVMDWGIAQPIPKDDSQPWVRPEFVAGTPRYISPETAMGKRTDHRSDIYSLGMILQEIVTLDYAAVGKDNEEIMRNISEGTLAKIEHKYGAPIEKDMIAIIRKATALNPENRYQSAKDLADDIRAYIQGNATLAKPDIWYTKILRWTSHHRNLMFLSLLAMIFLVLLSISYSIYSTLQQTRMMQEYTLAINLAYRKCLQCVLGLDHAFLTEQKNLEHLTRLSGYLLNHAPDTQKSGFILYDESGFLPRIPNGVHSPYYDMEISLDHAVAKMMPGASMAQQQKQLLQLTPLIPLFKKYLLDSLDLSSEYRSSHSTGIQRLLNSGAMIKSYYCGFENGLYIGYPCRDSVSLKVYDPRPRLWYKDAKEQTKPVWGKIYIGTDRSGMCLPCSMAIRDIKGKVLGVAGVDMNFDQIKKILKSLDDSASYIKEVVIIDINGRMVVNSREEEQKKLYSDQEVLKKQEMGLYDAANVRHKLRNSYCGVYSQGQMLYLFARFQSLDWIFVVKLDLEQYMKCWMDGNIKTEEFFDMFQTVQEVKNLPKK